jgi:hypothetical protein
MFRPKPTVVDWRTFGTLAPPAAYGVYPSRAAAAAALGVAPSVVSRAVALAAAAVDPSEVEPLAVVVDSGGRPVEGQRADGTTGPIAVYRQRTALPEDVKGRHIVWSSDEPDGDGYPFDKDTKKEFDRQVAALRGRPPEEFREQLRGLCRRYGRPYYLTRFMQEARAGEVSAAFAPTPRGRAAASGADGGRGCRCRGPGAPGGGPRWGRDAVPARPADGLNAAARKKLKRQRKLQERDT